MQESVEDLIDRLELEAAQSAEALWTRLMIVPMDLWELSSQEKNLILYALSKLWNVPAKEPER